MKLSLFLGILALALLFGVCLQTMPPRIEQDLTQKSSAVAGEQASWATVTLDGRDASVTGTAPSSTALDELKSSLTAIDGVRVVNTEEVVVAEATEAIAAVEAPPAAQPEPEIVEEPAEEQIATEPEIVIPPIETEIEKVVAEPELLEESEPLPLEESVAETESEMEYVEDNEPMPLEETVAETEPETEPQPQELAEAEIVPASLQKADQCQDKFEKLLSEQQILFRSNTSYVLPQSDKLLDQLAAVASDCKGLKLLISGHTDSRGSKKINDALSKARAEAVRDFFINKGIDKSLLTTSGLGSSKPIADNKTAEGRARNRRIEISIGG